MEHLAPANRATAPRRVHPSKRLPWTSSGRLGGEPAVIVPLDKPQLI
jgi:hypothetical protein